MVVKEFSKDPDAVLDYAFDWTPWLEDSETISSHTITTQTGLTKDSDSESDGIVTIWFSGGSAGIVYGIACKIVTSGGRTDERTATIRCVER